MKNTTYLFLAVLLICAGCPDQDFGSNREFTITNKTDTRLVSMLAFRIVTDTLLQNSNPYPTSEQLELNTINSQSSMTFVDAFDETFEQQSDKILMLYLFSRDTIEQVSWDQIVDEYLVLRRYDLTLEDLEAMDWTVEYP
ncbi:MAG: hypothetical protein AAGC43_18605 [Bacteroidota bacterium]